MPRWLRKILTIKIILYLAHVCYGGCYSGIVKNQTNTAINVCVSQCLGLLSPKKSKQKYCSFDREKGKALGDPCPKDYRRNQGDLYKVACDLMNFNLENEPQAEKYVQSCDIIADMLSLANFTRNIVQMKSDRPYLPSRKKDLKRWFVLEDNAEDHISYRKITKDKQSREEFVQKVASFSKENKYDGVIIKWSYPGCLGEDCSNIKMDEKANSIEFFKDLALRLHLQKNTAAFFTSGLHSTAFQAFGYDYYAEILKYLDFLVCKLHSQKGPWSAQGGATNSLEISKPIIDALSKALSEEDRKKVIITTSPFTTSFALVSNKFYHQFDSIPHNKVFTRLLNLPSTCKLIRNKKSQYVISRDPSVQNYAQSGRSWISFDDYNSTKAKVEELVKANGLLGVYIMDFYADDFKGECGCGISPYTRMFAEALNGGHCILPDCI